MPSRQPPPVHHQITRHLVPPLAGGLTAAFSFLILLTLCFGRIIKKRTAPSAADTDSKKPPHRLSYSLLRRATNNFSFSLRLGQGGFGSVYRATLKPNPITKNSTLHVAVKLMDSGSLQGEREFQNELLFSSKIECKYIVSVMGFSSNPGKRRMLLVYELMENGSLQDCLFHRKSQELKNWDRRFLIALHIAKGLEYLHHYCDPPIIHGDIKPSNILLDGNFNAKISDFGLARSIVEENIKGEVKRDGNLRNGVEDNGLVLEETGSVITTNGFEDFNNVHNLGDVERSPESVIVRVEDSPEVGVELSPEADAAPVVSPRTVAEMASPFEGLEKTSISEGNFDRFSDESGGEKSGWKKKKKSVPGKDWWWKQDNGGEGESGKVKDYVMEWIGNEIKKERPKSDWIVTSSSSGVVSKKEKKKKKKQRLDWWVSLDDEKNIKEKRRPAREWWKEEYCEELEKKKKKKKKQAQGSMSDDHYCENYWPGDDELYADRKKKRSRSRNSRGSMDWWLDGLNGELWKAQRNSYDSVSGEIPKSGGISSTPSMRGTVCYIAPEYGGGGDISEKCDVYSYGVLLLVLIAGRRPLQVTGSPMSKFQQANLLSWARNLARTGKLLDLVDQNIQSLNKEQALLCITVALLCLQKSPARRPSMKEVVGMLSGDLKTPPLPIEFSPSPPSRPHKSRKKSWLAALAWNIKLSVWRIKMQQSSSSVSSSSFVY
ncbi:receptor-like serine threonine- kinase At4g25390 [Olea europaea subsp. europaea]|uniref:non-specific serine/threonine protein kinase n=1 Tax=Olea europaea subsp. europaea TaxID=158383 RepID=A0A8S0PW20_OLEEU|nr:receptor-like serine threonine- kinase At4g25390 [Olea europaea subsp. europaea]